MIKLIFNRFGDGDGVTQDINTNINVKTTNTGTKEAAKSIRDLREALEQTDGKSITLNTASLDKSIKSLTELQKMIDTLRNGKKDIKVDASISKLQSSGLYDSLPSSVQGTLSQMSTLSGVVAKKSNYNEITKEITSLIDTLKTAQYKSEETTSTMSNGFGNVTDDVEKTNVSFKDFLNELKKAPSVVDALSKGFKSLNIVKLTYLFRAVRRVTSTMVDMVENAAGYEESLNLYMMALGEYADRATDWSDRITDALKLDPSDVMKYTGALYNLTKGLGVSSDAAYIMGTNLTQLTYDMASYLNISNDAAFAKIQSAMAGQSRAVATVGVATQMASLQELALSLGIKKSVSEMTQSEKTYLRYIQLMKNTTQMQGDLGRTMITPANAIRTLKNQINLLSRSIGQVMTPIIMQAIPYIMAFTNVLSRAAHALAEFFGYKLADVDFSSTFSFEDAAEGADNLDKLGSSAAGAAKKINNSLAPFDDLNVVLTENAGVGAGGGSGSVGDTIDSTIWDKLLPEYNMLKDYTGELVRQAKDLEDNIARIGVAIGTVIAVVKIAEWIKKIAELKTALSELGPVATGAFKIFTGGAMIAGGNLIFDSLIDGFLHAESEIMTISERIKASIGTLLFTLGGAAIGSVIAPGIGTIVGALVGLSGALADASLKGAAASEIAKLGLPVISQTSDAIADCNKQLEGLTGPLDYNIKSVSDLYGNYDILVSKLDQVVDENGKVKEGHEAEAKVIVDQLNDALGMHMELQNGTIKNYKKERKEIKETLEEHRRAAYLKAYYEKYAKTLTEVDNATTNYKKAVDNLLNAKDKEAKASGKSGKAYKAAQEEVRKAQDAYDGAKKEYITMLADKAKYEALYLATSQKQWDKVDDIIKNSAYTQTYWVGQALVGMTNELEGPMSDTLLEQWRELANDDSDAFNEGLKNIGDDDTKRYILQSMGYIGDSLLEYADEHGIKFSDHFVVSAQDELDTHHMSAHIETDETPNKKGGLLDKIRSIFDNNTIGTKFKTDETTNKPNGLFKTLASVFTSAIGIKFAFPSGQSIFDTLSNYFKNHPLSLKFKSVAETTGKVVTKLKNILGFETGGFPTSGDLFFANENGRAEFISSIGNRTVVANQDQMVQAVSNAIIAGFNKFNGGGSTTQPITINLGNETLWKGKVNHDKQQLDRYGSSSVIQV